MSTRSHIGIMNHDGTVTYIYCHFDGYPEHNGQILLYFYNTEERVRELMELGNLSILDRNAFPDPRRIHKFGHWTDINGDFHEWRQEGVCLFYGRDGGMDGWEAVKACNVRRYFNNPEAPTIDYFYLFHPDTREWECKPRGKDSFILNAENTAEKGEQ